MTDSVVFESSRDDSGNRVFDYGYLVATGTQYVWPDDFVGSVGTLEQTPSLDVAFEVFGVTYTYPITVPTIAARSELQHVALARTWTTALIETPTLEIWTALTLEGIGEVTQDPTLDIDRGGRSAFGIDQTPTLGVTFSVSGGATHSTFFWPAGFAGAGTFAQNPELEVNAGLLVSIPTLQAQASVIEVAVSTVSGGYTTVVCEVPGLVQTPSLVADLFVDRKGPQTAGWLLEPLVEKKVELPNPALERARRERERIAAERLAAAAELAARQKAADARMAALKQAMAPADVMDAAFKAAYEGQIAQLTGALQQQGSAASEMIARLQREVATLQAEKQQAQEQENEDAAVALLLLKQ